jgi:hypothetical protein
METLYRAEETGDQQDGSGSGGGIMEDDSAGPASTRAPESEPDDYYGRTSEIIAFAEPGKDRPRPRLHGNDNVIVSIKYTDSQNLRKAERSWLGA